MSSKKEFDILRESIQRIEASQLKSETNHWAHVQASTSALEERFGALHKDIQDLVKLVTTHASDMAWLKKFFWIIAAGSIGSLLTALLQPLLNKR